MPSRNCTVGLTCTDDIVGKRTVTVEPATGFRAVKDYANFTRSPLKVGDIVRLTSFGHYDIDSDGRFARIRAGSFGEPTKNEAASLEQEGMAAGHGPADT